MSEKAFFKLNPNNTQVMIMPSEFIFILYLLTYLAEYNSNENISALKLSNAKEKMFLLR